MFSLVWTQEIGFYPVIKNDAQQLSPMSRVNSKFRKTPIIALPSFISGGNNWRAL